MSERPFNPELFERIVFKGEAYETDITLRDLFAAMAMLSTFNSCEQCYRIADTMLQEREKREKETK